MGIGTTWKIRIVQHSDVGYFCLGIIRTQFIELIEKHSSEAQYKLSTSACTDRGYYNYDGKYERKNHMPFR